MAQTIDFTAIANQLTTNRVTLAATASSGLNVDFAVESGPAVLSDLTTLTFTNSGEVTISATQAGDTDWAPAYATNTFTVSRVPVTIVLTDLTQRYDGTPKGVVSHISPIGPVALITYNGSVNAPTEPGSYAVTATVVSVLYDGEKVDTLTIQDVPRMKMLSGTNEVPTNATASVLFGTDFGTVATNEAASVVLSITNSGAMPLNISGVTTSGTGAAWMSVSNLPSQVAVGTMSNCTVYWAPGEFGPFDMQLVLANDSVTPQFELNLRGTGIKPGEIGINAAQLSYEAVWDGAEPAAQSFVLTNKGEQAFAWTNVVNYSAGGSGWLTLTPWNGTQGTGAATVVTGTVQIAGLNAGTYRATNAITAPSTLNSPVEMVFELTLAKKAQSITFTNPGTQFSTNTTLLSATASSGLPVSFEVVSGAAELSGQTNLTYRSFGSVTVRAMQAGSVNYAAATAVTQSFDVVRVAQQELAFTPVTPQTYAATQTLSTAGGSGTGIVEYAVLSGSGRIEGGTNLIAAAGSGTISIRAYKASDAKYESKSVTAQVVCAKASQIMTFPKPDDTTVTNTTVLTASTSSGLGVTYRVISGPAQLNTATTLVYTAQGEVSVAADQSGNNNWLPASATQSFTVVKAFAQVTLTHLTQTYDSTAKQPDSQTSPAGLSVNLTYDGLSWAPTNAGSYAVTAT